MWLKKGEERGFFPPARRDPTNGHRYYTREDIERLKARRARRAGGRREGGGLLSEARAKANTRRYAESYLRRGLSVVPIPEGRKRPVIPSWQTLRLRLEELDRYFYGRPQNIGILLGEPSGWVVDVDLDARGRQSNSRPNSCPLPSRASGRVPAVRTGGTARREPAPSGGRTLTA